MPRPKKETVGVRSGNTGEKKKKLVAPTATPNVRVKRTPRPKAVPVKGTVNVTTDPELGNENECSLFLHLTSTAGIAELSYEIPVQTLTLKMTRVHFKTIQASQSYPAIGIVLTMLSPVQLNNNLNSAMIPIMSNYSSVDVVTNYELPLTLGKFIPRRVSYRVIDITTNNTIPEGIIDFSQVLFGYSVGVIN